VVTDTDDPTRADEAEAAVLGCLILDSTLLAQLGPLTPGDFANPHHALVLAAIREATDTNQGRADHLLVAEVLTRHGDLTRIGGMPHLHTLMSTPPSAGSIGHYARAVTEAATRRRLLALAVKLRQACGSHSIDDALHTAAQISVEVGVVADSPLDAVDDQLLSEVRELRAFTTETTEPYQWVIPGLLEVMDRVVVVASEGAGKTTWARMVAVMLGQGLHPLNPALQIPPRRSLIVDLENPPALIRRKSRHLVDTATARTGWINDQVFVWSRPGGVNLRKAPDLALLDRVVAHVRPALVCLGPLYKAGLDGGDRGEQVAAETAAALDKIRAKHRCALWLEHHAPMEQNGSRMMRPVGSGLWSRWPELGIALTRDGQERDHRFTVTSFRGHRDERCWPDYLTWGRTWPFDAGWHNGMPGSLHDGNFTTEGAA